MNYYVILFYILISTLPGIYLATKKYFLVFTNRKYNLFGIRLIYCVPAMAAWTLLLSLFPLVVFYVFLVDKFPIYIVLLCPLLASIFLTLIFEKYIIRKDIPFELRSDFMNHDLYVFIPDVRNRIDSNYAYRGRYTAYILENSSDYVYPKRSAKQFSKQLFFGKQISNLILNFKLLNEINFTFTGEFVVNNKALQIFQENNLTGYQV